MKVSKRVLKHPGTQFAVAWLLTQYIRFVYITSIHHRITHEDSRPYACGDMSGIYTLWHGRLMMCIKMKPPKRKMHVLSSRHRDGMLVSRVIRFFGQIPIYGSSSKGGSTAAKEMLRVLKKGDNMCITPDGPRGPAQIAGKGIVAIARISGRPIIPIAFSSTRCRRFNSWDNFVLPLPFSRLVFCTGAPISVSKDADEQVQEKARLMIENTMNQLLIEADRIADAYRKKKTHV